MILIRGEGGDWTRKSSRNFRANGFFDNGNSKLSALAFSINGRKDETSNRRGGMYFANICYIRV